MLGPLPTLYRATVVLAVLVVSGAAGAWAAFMLPYPILLTAGASVGLAVGAVSAFLLVHEGSQAPHPPRLPRRRLD